MALSLTLRVGRGRTVEGGAGQATRRHLSGGRGRCEKGKGGSGGAQHPGPHGPHVARTPHEGPIRACSVPGQNTHTQTSPWHTVSPRPFAAPWPARGNHARTRTHTLKARMRWRDPEVPPEGALSSLQPQ